MFRLLRQVLKGTHVNWAKQLCDAQEKAFLYLTELSLAERDAIFAL
jgi:hypothetical protein